MPARYTDEQRLKVFLSKIHTGLPDECWLWQGAVGNHGYGTASTKGRKPRGAHVIAWELQYGAVPLGLCVCHHCDVKLCCNPSHLFLGTRQENNADRDRKGRCVRGEESKKARLAEADIAEIGGAICLASLRNQLRRLSM